MPVDGAEKRLNFLEQHVVDDTVETLPVVINDPPQIAHIVFPTFQQGFEDIAFVEFRIPHQRHHAPWTRVFPHEPVQPGVILYQRCEQRFRNAQPNGAGGKINVARVLSARRIGLRPAQPAKLFHRRPVLPAQQVHQRVKHRAGVRFDGNSVFDVQHIHI